MVALRSKAEMAAFFHSDPQEAFTERCSSIPRSAAPAARDENDEVRGRLAQRKHTVRFLDRGPQSIVASCTAC